MFETLEIRIWALSHYFATFERFSLKFVLKILFEPLPPSIGAHILYNQVASLQTIKEIKSNGK